MAAELKPICMFCLEPYEIATCPVCGEPNLYCLKDEYHSLLCKCPPRPPPEDDSVPELLG